MVKLLHPERLSVFKLAGSGLGSAFKLLQSARLSLDKFTGKFWNFVKQTHLERFSVVNFICNHGNSVKLLHPSRSSMLKLTGNLGSSVNFSHPLRLRVFNFGGRSGSSVKLLHAERLSIVKFAKLLNPSSPSFSI
jgi:hypothetical protein